MTTGNTIALTRWTFVGKVMSLIFNMLSWLVAGRSYPTSEARGSGRKEQPHLQGAVAAWVQEGLEELFHVQDQKGWR